MVCGAFMFGLGMQLGGGCASGTLYTAGGGNTRMLITLIAFIAGSVLGTWQWPIWQDTMGLAPISLSQSFGLVGGILISFVIFAVIWYISILYEKVEMSPSSLNLGVVFQRFGARSCSLGP